MTIQDNRDEQFYEFICYSSRRVLKDLSIVYIAQLRQDSYSGMINWAYREARNDFLNGEETGII